MLTYADGDNNDSVRIKTYASIVDENSILYYGYEYDDKGNVIRISSGSYPDALSTQSTYIYDDLNQLIIERDYVRDTVTYYTYDKSGNIELKEIINSDNTIGEIDYEYSSSQWGDLLTSYNGRTITYDGIGNPLSYYNGSSYTFTWDGRRLSTAQIGSSSYSFKYNDEGLRTVKTKNGTTTNYLYYGSLLNLDMFKFVFLF